MLRPLHDHVVVRITSDARDQDPDSPRGQASRGTVVQSGVAELRSGDDVAFGKYSGIGADGCFDDQHHYAVLNVREVLGVVEGDQ